MCGVNCLIYTFYLTLCNQFSNWHLLSHLGKTKQQKRSTCLTLAFRIQVRIENQSQLLCSKACSCSSPHLRSTRLSLSHCSRATILIWQNNFLLLTNLSMFDVQRLTVPALNINISFFFPRRLWRAFLFFKVLDSVFRLTIYLVGCFLHFISTYFSSCDQSYLWPYTNLSALFQLSISDEPPNLVGFIAIWKSHSETITEDLWSYSMAFCRLYISGYEYFIRFIFDTLV